MSRKIFVGSYHLYRADLAIKNPKSKFSKSELSKILKLKIAKFQTGKSARKFADRKLEDESGIADQIGVTESGGSRRLTAVSKVLADPFANRDVGIFYRGVGRSPLVEDYILSPSSSIAAAVFVQSAAVASTCGVLLRWRHGSRTEGDPMRRVHCGALLRMCDGDPALP